MNENLSKKLSVYNFLCTFFIVVYHSKNFNDLFSSQSSKVLQYIYNLYDFLGAIALGVFFTMSGYLLYYGINGKSDAIKKLQKRVWSLVIPFFLWNTLMLCYEIVYALFKNNLHLTFKDLLLGYSFDAFVGPFWYILALIILLTLCPLLYKLKKRPSLFGTIVIAVSFGAFILSMFDFGDNLLFEWIKRFVNFLPCYLFGAFLGLCKSDKVANEDYNVKVVTLVSALATIIFVLLFVFGLKNSYVNWMICHIIPITFWLILPGKMFSNIKITYYMRTTFFVFATHMLLIGILNTILQKVVGNGSMPLFVTIPLHFVCITIIFVICNLFSFVARKILPQKVYSMLSGGRA